MADSSIDLFIVIVNAHKIQVTARDCWGQNLVERFSLNRKRLSRMVPEKIGCVDIFIEKLEVNSDSSLDSSIGQPILLVDFSIYVLPGGKPPD